MAIVCGTDFTPNAEAACDAAAAIAARTGRTLELVHVADGGDRDAAARRLDAEAERLRRRGATVEGRLLEGAPDETLVEHVNAAGAWLIVVGALGRRSRSRWAIGSTADRVAQTAAVPVLVVRSPAAFEAWAQDGKPLRVLVGADFSGSAQAAIRWTRALAEAGPCEVRIVHVYWPPEEHARLGIRGAVSMVDVHPEVEKVLARELATRFHDDAAGLGEIHVELSLGRVADSLVWRADRDADDLVVVGTHQRSGLDRLWHGSVSAGVLQGASASVACVPAAAAAGTQARSLPVVRSVLAATDFSELADEAVLHAWAVVADGGTVHLLHVIEPAELGATPNPLYAHFVRGRAPTPEERRALHREVADRLRQLVPAAAAARGITTECHVVEEASVAEAIARMAERLGVALVCLGSHGRSGLGRAFLGSVAEDVVRRGERPVLIVRRPEPVDPGD